jgi:hypothetical protein
LRKNGKRPRPHKRTANALQKQKRPRRKRPSSEAGQQAVATITIDGDLDSHALETIKLELRALARASGLEVSGIEVRTSKRG